MSHMALMSSLYTRHLNRVLTSPQLGFVILVLTLSVSVLISARSWSASWCQEGVLEILGTRNTPTLSPTAQPSLRVLLSTGKLSLKCCSWLGEPELSWQSTGGSHNENKALTLYLRAQRQGQVWFLSWRSNSSHSVWRSLNTIFAVLPKSQELSKVNR